MEIKAREILKRDTKGSEYKDLETLQINSLPAIGSIIKIKNKKYRIQTITNDEKTHIRYADVLPARAWEQEEMTKAQKEASKVFDREGRLVS